MGYQLQFLPYHIRAWLLLARSSGGCPKENLTKIDKATADRDAVLQSYLLHFPIEETPVAPDLEVVMIDIMNEIIHGECDPNKYFDETYGLITEVPDILEFHCSIPNPTKESEIRKCDELYGLIPNETIELVKWQKDAIRDIMGTSPIIAVFARRREAIKIVAVIIENTGRQIELNLSTPQPKPGESPTIYYPATKYIDPIVLPKMYIDLIKKTIHAGLNMRRDRSFLQEKMSIYNAVTHFTPITAYVYLNMYPYDYLDM